MILAARFFFSFRRKSFFFPSGKTTVGLSPSPGGGIGALFPLPQVSAWTKFELAPLEG